MSKICKGAKFGFAVFMAALIIGFISLKRVCAKKTDLSTIKTDDIE